MRPPICPFYPSNICGASLPEAFRLSTSLSACYSNNSCNSARSLFSAVLSCNPCFFCRGCKTARSSFAPTFFRNGRCHDICLRHCSCSALLHIRLAWLCMKRLCTGFRGRNGVLHREIRDTLQLYSRQLQRITRLSCCRPLTARLRSGRNNQIFLTHTACHFWLDFCDVSYTFAERLVGFKIAFQQVV